MMTHQSNSACFNCGSFSRDGILCNKCGYVCAEVETAEEKHFVRASAGRQWSKQKHRYLTAKEIAKGGKGG